jgi:hypothetical protein
MADFLNSTSWISLRAARDLVAKRLYLGAEIPAYPAQKLLREQLEAGNVRWRCPRIDGRDPLNYYAPGDSRFWELSNPNFRLQIGLKIDWERSSASRRYHNEFEIVASDIEVALEDVMALHRGLERPIVGYTSDESAVAREAWFQGASPAEQHEAVLVHRRGKSAAMNLEAARIQAEAIDKQFEAHQQAASAQQAQPIDEPQPAPVAPEENKKRWQEKASKEALEAAMGDVAKEYSDSGTEPLSDGEIWGKLKARLPDSIVTRKAALDVLERCAPHLKGRPGHRRRNNKTAK